MQFLKKVTFEPLMNFTQNHSGSYKYLKANTFKSFLHLRPNSTSTLHCIKLNQTRKNFQSVH